MAIPNVTPYNGQKPVPGQDQPTFNQNMSDELDYFNALPAELNPAIDAMNQTATDVDDAKTAAEAAASEAATSASAAAASGNYQGEFTSGVTSATAGESYSFGGSTWLCLANTTTDPSVGNANWRKVVSLDDVNAAEERAIGAGVSIYRGSNGNYVQDGDTVPVGTTHLAVLINGIVEDVKLSELYNGVIQSIENNGFSVKITFTDLKVVYGRFLAIYDFRVKKVSEIPGVFRRLTVSEIKSTDPITDPEADITTAFNEWVATVDTGSVMKVVFDGTYGISDALTWENKNIVPCGIDGAGIDVDGCGIKWLAGRNTGNSAKGFFTIIGSRFVTSGDLRLIPPACYAPTNDSYDEDHTLGWAVKELWRQEESHRVSTTLGYSRLYIGRYDADGWGDDFKERTCRHIKYGFWSPNEVGFNNDGNNDFHQFDTIIMNGVDVASKIENRQNLGWRFKNLQFFFGTSVHDLPVGGQIYYENLWVAGTTGVNGVFKSGTSGSTSEIARIYIHNLNCEGIRNDNFIQAVGDSLVMKVTGGGSCGFRTQEGTNLYTNLVSFKDTVRTDIRLNGIQILEDTGSGEVADFRLRYDTNSKENNLFFEGCWGDYFDTASLQTGTKTGWSVQFSDVKPTVINRRDGDFSQSGSYSYLVNYSDDTGLRDGTGRIPLSNVYSLGYMQQISALAVGRLGVDALTIVKSKTFRVKPTAATSFVITNVLEAGWRVIGVDAYFIYNDLGAAYFTVESGDTTPFQFGGGVSNGSSANRLAPLTGGDNGMLFVGNLRLRFRGYSDAAHTTPAAFSGSASGISDSTTIAVTIHYIDLERRYLDIEEYNKLDVTSGV